LSWALSLWTTLLNTDYVLIIWLTSAIIINSRSIHLIALSFQQLNFIFKLMNKLMNRIKCHEY
jgi:hypothetical protein